MRLNTKRTISLLAGLMMIMAAGCSSGNLSEVKSNAEFTFRANGFEVVGYHGYKWGAWGFNDYGGARVWYTVKKPDNKIVYQAALQRWGNEYHLYCLKAVDAIKP